MLVRENITGASPVIDAVTAKVPTVEVAVTAGDVAVPVTSVFTDTVLRVPKRAVGPLLGAVKVTGTPLTPRPAASVTATLSADGNVVFICAAMRSPALVTIFARSEEHTSELQSPLNI